MSPQPLGSNRHSVGADALESDAADFVLLPEAVIRHAAPRRSPRWARDLGDAMLLVAGIAVGPHGLAVTTPRVLSVLLAALPVALAALGVALAFAPRHMPMRVTGVMAMSGIRPIVSAVVVGLGVFYLLRAGLAPGLEQELMLSLSIAAAAATARATAWQRSDVDDRPSPTLAGVENVVALVLAGCLMAGARASSLVQLVSLIAQAAGIASVTALTGWLLLAREPSDSEQRVFGIAMLLLIGGAAAYLSFPALLIGLIAGVLWRWCGGTTQSTMERNVAYLGNPVLFLVLFVAGLQVEFTARVLALAAAYIVLRTAARIVSGHVLGVPGAVRGETVAEAVRPGVLGVALALDVAAGGAAEPGVLISVVALATIGADCFAAYVTRRNLA